MKQACARPLICPQELDHVLPHFPVLIGPAHCVKLICLHYSSVVMKSCDSEFSVTLNSRDEVHKSEFPNIRPRDGPQAR